MILRRLRAQAEPTASCRRCGQALPGTVAPSDISVVGPMARSAADLAVALDVMAGPDEIEGQGWRLALPGAAP